MMFDLVKADVAAILGTERGWAVKVGLLLFHSGMHAVLLYRLSRWLRAHRLAPLAVLVGYVNSVLTGAQLSPRASIGRGFVIYHPFGTVVGSSAVIGDFCTLIHGNVVGQLVGGADRPVIGDHFYAGTGAKMLGRITIGHNVRVGANSVVLHSLPDDVTVSGIPARIIMRPRDDSSRRAADSAVSRETIGERLARLLRSTVPEAARFETLNESTGLLGGGMGGDSVEILTLVSAIEEKFGLTIDEAELEVSHFKTIGALVNFIEERISR